MRPRTIPVYAVLASAALAGCATYQADPIDPLRVLGELDALQWNQDPQQQVVDDRPRAGPRELSAFAVSTNPELAALRSSVGVRKAVLVEAGLLPDPSVGWDAMDVLAAQIVDGTSSSVEVLSGFGLMFPLPRPGERGARVGAAEWRVEEAIRQVAVAEWQLTRRVHLAFEEVRAAEELLAQTQVVTSLAQSTYDYFLRARDAGTATAIQANLASGELQGIRLQALQASGRARRARQALNWLLGLPPSFDLHLREAGDPTKLEELAQAPEELTAYAVEHRPDLKALLAGYQAAEEEVRIAISKQFPRLSIGTGINFTIPLFSRFGRPAIDTALARREQLHRQYRVAVHSTRRDIATAKLALEQATQEVALVETELLPNAEENLELSRAAFAAGEVTLLETIALQRALVAARTRHIEVRAERSKRAWSLLAAAGLLLSEPTQDSTNDEGAE